MKMAAPTLTAWQRWRMCDSKKMYETQSKANKAATKLGPFAESYSCPLCFCWHVTKGKSRQI